MRYAHKTDPQSIFRSFFSGNTRLWYLLASLSILCFASLLTPLPGAAADTAKQTSLSERTVIRGSGYPVPRFVTLKKDLAYLRVGPGREYQLDWVYVRQNLPLKVVSEFDVWRKVVDHEGTTGWLHSSLLSLKRFGLVTKAEIKLYDSPEDSSKIVAVAGRNVLLEVQYCEKQWCRLATKDVRGWTKRQNFWGVLENEEVE
jgi:SH3-like domain-containing protein